MKQPIFGFLLISGIVGLTSCYQDPEPGTAKITVVDVNDFRVLSANVTLSQDGNGTGIIHNQGITDMNGEYLYTFEHFQIKQGVEAIVNIYAEKDGADGKNTIRIKPNETSTRTVKIF